jgi:hypothetical protein
MARTLLLQGNSREEKRRHTSPKHLLSLEPGPGGGPIAIRRVATATLAQRGLFLLRSSYLADEEEVRLAPWNRAVCTFPRSTDS